MVPSPTVVALASCLLACSAAPGDRPEPTCSGHDEDGDGFPDACDVCPTVFDPDQLDNGELDAGNPADGVGDACDPRPTLAGDYIAFVRMHDDEATNPYDQLYGTAAWTDDALELGAIAGAGEADFTLPALPSRIEIRAHVVAAAASDIVWFGVWYDDNADDNPKLFAQGAQDVGRGKVEFALKQSNTPGPDHYSARVPGPTAFAAGQQFDLIVETGLATGGDDSLTVVEGSGKPHATTLELTIQPDRRGFLEAYRMIVAFDHLIAYAIH